MLSRCPRDSTFGIRSIGFTCRKAQLLDKAQVENAVDAPADSKDAEKGASQFRRGEAMWRASRLADDLWFTDTIGYLCIAFKLTTQRNRGQLHYFSCYFERSLVSFVSKPSAKIREIRLPGERKEEKKRSRSRDWVASPIPCLGGGFRRFYFAPTWGDDPI